MTSTNPKRLKMNEEAPMQKNMSFKFCTSDFSEVVKSPGFVDKTLFIQDILNGEDKILITAPRRSGKSTNLDMVKKYVKMQTDANGILIDKYASANYQIFMGKNIFQDQTFFRKYFATYPVIYADFKCVSGKTFEEVLMGFRTALRDSFSNHGYLLKSDIWSQGGLDIVTFKKYIDSEESEALNTEQIKKGFQFLSECLYKHFGKIKVFVLIDEYDAPINNVFFEDNIKIEDVNNLLCAIFSNTLKENDYVGRALLTGISYFASVGLSGVNNIKKYMFLDDHPFVKYNGLIESEVDTLLSTIDEVTKEAVKSFYNGYCSRGKVKIFSLWSVLHYLKSKELTNYWEQSGLMYGLCEALRFPLIQIAIEKLLKNESVKTEIFRNLQLHDLVKLQNIVLGRTSDEINSKPDLLLNFLLQQGYLTYNGVDNCVKIPTKGIHIEFRKEVEDYFGGNTTLQLCNRCSTAFDQISVSNIGSFQKFAETFQNVVYLVSDAIIKENERIFHSLLICVLCRANFQIIDDVEFFGSRDRPDLICVKGKNGFMFEVKYKVDSKKALQQIIDKEYYKMFERQELKVYGDFEHKVYLGLAVDEDSSVSLAVLVDSLDIQRTEYFSR